MKTISQEIEQRWNPAGNGYQRANWEARREVMESPEWAKAVREAGQLAKCASDEERRELVAAWGYTTDRASAMCWWNPEYRMRKAFERARWVAMMRLKALSIGPTKTCTLIWHEIQVIGPRTGKMGPCADSDVRWATGQFIRESFRPGA